MEVPAATSDLAKLREGLGPLPEPVSHPVLVVVSGLPGAGKSYFCQRLAQRLPLLVVETDALRRRLFGKPSYRVWEHQRLFAAVHRLLDELLGQGISLVLDATNLSEYYRERLYHIAERRGAKLILVWVEAPPEVVAERLASRARGETGDNSEADWEVYQRMKSKVQPIRRNHFPVDTSRDITPVIEKVVREARK